ncbi:hypothetical protein MMC13_000337 [Lambiella insularis]|nr:hypothetical protein [Lambiella insularis]
MDGTAHKFKEFTENSDGFPNKLPDDCVEYAIYILDQTLNDSAIRERLRDVQSASNKLTRAILKDFIWQRDDFALELAKEDGNVGPSSRAIYNPNCLSKGVSHLRGRTNYGDSIEDEWLIVYLLRELSKQFPEIWVRIVDSDGEFLLIEAANAIPQWLNPEVADNRVWLNNSQLLIVNTFNDNNEGPADLNRRHRALTLQEAWTCIRGARSQLFHSQDLEAEAFYRLRNYPKQINASLHHAIARIPRKVAYLLHQDKAYISPAVEAFYLRDPIALRPLQNASHRDLVFPPVELVTVSVTLPKISFAQLKSQRFAAPASWTPEMSTSTSEQLQTQTELGMKITSGFEMLISDFQNQDNKTVREIMLLLEDISLGEDELPSDSEIASWALTEDDEAWLDINFQDFENELCARSADKEIHRHGFGDQSAHENLRKMVARFEDFLNDDAAGSEGAEYPDDMDNDNDEDEDIVSTNISSESEDEAVSFDEAEFAKTMREMMGMPLITGNDQSAAVMGKGGDAAGHANARTAGTSIMNEESEILRLQQAMEAELKEAGALQLEPLAVPRGLNSSQGNIKGGKMAVSQEEDMSNGGGDDEGLQIDYNLAKNMLESFKSQAGTAGPGSNLMGLMGMRLPRDEEETPPSSAISNLR